MIELPRGIDERGAEIVRLEIGHLGKDLIGGQSGCVKVKDIRDPDSHATDTRTAAAPLRIGGDSVKDIGHCVAPGTVHPYFVQYRALLEIGVLRAMFGRLATMIGWQAQADAPGTTLPYGCE